MVCRLIVLVLAWMDWYPRHRGVRGGALNESLKGHRLKHHQVKRGGFWMRILQAQLSGLRRWVLRIRLVGSVYRNASPLHLLVYMLTGHFVVLHLLRSEKMRAARSKYSTSISLSLPSHFLNHRQTQNLHHGIVGLNLPWLWN